MPFYDIIYPWPDMVLRVCAEQRLGEKIMQSIEMNLNGQNCGTQSQYKTKLQALKVHHAHDSCVVVLASKDELLCMMFDTNTCDLLPCGESSAGCRSKSPHTLMHTMHTFIVTGQ